MDGAKATVIVLLLAGILAASCLGSAAPAGREGFRSMPPQKKSINETVKRLGDECRRGNAKGSCVNWAVTKFSGEFEPQKLNNYFKMFCYKKSRGGPNKCGEEFMGALGNPKFRQSLKNDRSYQGREGFSQGPQGPARRPAQPPMPPPPMPPTPPMQPPPAGPPPRPEPPMSPVPTPPTAPFWPGRVQELYRRCEGRDLDACADYGVLTREREGFKRAKLRNYLEYACKQGSGGGKLCGKIFLEKWKSDAFRQRVLKSPNYR